MQPPVAPKKASFRRVPINRKFSDPVESIHQLKAQFPRSGKLEWISIRPERMAPVRVVDRATVDANHGLVGDHHQGRAGSKRMVTFIQQEHIEAVAKLLDQAEIDPGLLRRNIVVSGINLFSLRDCEFQIGDAVFIGTGPCPPCSRMEMNLGAGGYNAMRGHGGLNASVIQGGEIQVGDELTVITTPNPLVAARDEE